jgi:hypothetical protein
LWKKRTPGSLSFLSTRNKFLEQIIHASSVLTSRATFVDPKILLSYARN